MSIRFNLFDAIIVFGGLILIIMGLILMIRPQSVFKKDNRYNGQNYNSGRIFGFVIAFMGLMLVMAGIVEHLVLYVL